MKARTIDIDKGNGGPNNLWDSTGLAILLLDRDLTIRRFSTQAGKQFRLLSADIGCPLDRIRHSLDMANLDSFVKEAITNVRNGKYEVCDKDGRWFSLRVHPYLTPGNKVDGAVLVLVDIDDFKRVEREIESARAYAEGIIRTVRDPLIILREDLRVNTANDGFYKAFKMTPGQTEGHLIFELADGAWEISELHMYLKDVLSRNKSFSDFEITHEFPRIGRRSILLNACRLEQRNDAPQTILLAMKDVTERRRADSATASLAAIVNSSDDAIIGKDLNGTITSWNKGAEHLFGYTAWEAIGRPITMLFPADRLEEEYEILGHVRRGEPVDHMETVRIRKDGSLVEISLTVSPIRDAAGRVIGASKIAHDITARKQAEAEFKAYAEDLARFNRVAVGRETRMIELKKEINELCRRQGETARYPLEFEQDDGDAHD